MTPRQALAHAIELFGHVRCLAWSLDVPCREVEQWSEVPAEHVERCAAITGIPRAVLRPDEGVPAAQPDLFVSKP